LHCARTAVDWTRSQPEAEPGEAAPVTLVDRSLRLLRYDVFTERPFAGNPLGVVLDHPPLTTDQMQRVARELNLSETVFLTDRGDGSWTARIFTPAVEHPFAGHPTIGAAIALADEGRVEGEVVLHEGVGPVSVTLAGGTATLTTPGPPAPVEVADPSDVLGAVGLSFTDLHPELGVRGWSVGVPFTMLAVREPDVLAGVAVDRGAWDRVLAHTPAPDLYLLAPVDGIRGGRWRARMFGPSMDIVEDPATGSAAAASAGFLAGAVGDARLEEGWTIEQGVEMGRPSELHVQPVRRNGELVAVRVGGAAVRVGSGTLAIPT
jgi:trans-2,3-dihydro-3-hydroxyanthranilate isomerase